MNTEYHVMAEEWDRLMTSSDHELLDYVSKNPDFNNWLILYARQKFIMQMKTDVE